MERGCAGPADHLSVAFKNVVAMKRNSTASPRSRDRKWHREMTGHRPATDVAQQRGGLPAHVLCNRAAWMEVAARRRMCGARYIAAQNDAGALPFGIGCRHG